MEEEYKELYYGLYKLIDKHLDNETKSNEIKEKYEYKKFVVKVISIAVVTVALIISIFATSGITNNNTLNTTHKGIERGE